jgi:methanogenesis imperfect marker protein 11
MVENDKILTREEIQARIKDKPWVSPFEKIVAIYDATEDLVQVYETHARNACYGAAAWAMHHYKRTSPLVLDAKRDGVRDIILLKPGSCELTLKPSYSSAGIEAVKVENNIVKITYAGLAGGGVGSTFSRALARGVKGAILHNEGGGDRLGRATLVLEPMKKLHVGLDDTDRTGEGATWSLANEIGYQLGSEEGIEYLNHTLVQLYPGTPEKTTNCVATVLTFAVMEDKLEYLRSELARRVRNQTLSEHTGLAISGTISIPEVLTQFSNKAKREIITIDQARATAKELGIELISVTGERGCIGALAALGYAERHEAAVQLESGEGTANG